ncbi:MAG: hypothetical protein K2X27_05995 [Candidatus Obscuribacterales bacterium]|nr:hypothetical protein [Candidatus Obscuribacterales bacterium]
MSSAAHGKYHESAEKALGELDSEKAEELFLSLIVSIEEAFNKNQKDVATELQRIAKEIESSGKVDDSVRFKQKTCEIMLRRSMAERRRNQAPPAPPNKDARSFTQMLFVCFSSEPAAYAAFLQKTGLSTELKILPDGSRWLRGKDSTLMLICRQGKLSGFFPLLVASSREDAARQLQDHGHFLDGEEIDVCGMRIQVIKDKTGQRILLAGAEIMQNV